MAFDRPRIRDTDLDRPGQHELLEADTDELDAGYGPQEAPDEDFGPVEDDWPQEPRSPEAEAAAQRHVAEAIAEYQRQQAELARQEAERRRRSADLNRLVGRSERGDQSPEDRRRRDTQQALRTGIAPTEPRTPETPAVDRSHEQPSIPQPEAIRDSPAAESQLGTQHRGTAVQQSPAQQRPAQQSPARQGSGGVQGRAPSAARFQPAADQLRSSEALAAQWLQQAQQTESRLMAAHSAQTTDPRIVDARQALRVGLPPQRPSGTPLAPVQPPQPAPGQPAARAAGRYRPGNNRGSSGHRHEL